MGAWWGLGGAWWGLVGVPKMCRGEVLKITITHVTLVAD